MQGVSLANVCLLRLDRLGGPAPGNKSFKLANYFTEAKRLGLSRLVSFGGAWSNHLHALAAAGGHHGFETIGIVRGDDAVADSAMLYDARRCGMRLLRVSREEYRRRHDPAYLQALSARFHPCLLIPEGAASITGARGCMAIADLICRHVPHARQIVVAVGTGTTLAGLVAGLDKRFKVVGISALKGAVDLDLRVRDMIVDIGAENSGGTAGDLAVDSRSRICAQWRILHEFHCGGFARVDTPLREFIQAFETIHGVPLEPVYTGKMMFAVHQLRKSGEWNPAAPVLALHTGGLQGRRGYPWLAGV